MPGKPGVDAERGCNDLTVSGAASDPLTKHPKTNFTSAMAFLQKKSQP